PSIGWPWGKSLPSAGIVTTINARSGGTLYPPAPAATGGGCVSPGIAGIVAGPIDSPKPGAGIGGRGIPGIGIPGIDGAPYTPKPFIGPLSMYGIGIAPPAPYIGMQPQSTRP